MALDPVPHTAGAKAKEHPALVNARLAVEQDPVRLEKERWLASEERRQANEILKAIRLGSTLAVTEALLRGEKVPRSALDPKWLKAYGL